MYQDSEKYNTLSGRLKNYTMMKLMLGITIFSIGVMIFLFTVSQSAFFAVAIFMFVLAGFGNFMYYKKRARYYVSNFSADADKITIHYFDKDEPQQVTIKWSEFDYYFGSVKGDNYLVIWHKNVEIMKLYKTFGTHNSTLMSLNDAFQKYISPERIKNTVR